MEKMFSLNALKMKREVLSFKEIQSSEPNIKRQQVDT